MAKPFMLSDFQPLESSRRLLIIISSSLWGSMVNAFAFNCLHTNMATETTPYSCVQAVQSYF